MDIVMIYFSGTGNTQLICEKLGNAFEDLGHEVTCVSIEDKPAIDRLDFRDKIIGFGYPVYKFSYPDNLEPWIALFNEKASEVQEKVPCFMFSTYARFPATAHVDFANALKQSAFDVIGMADYKAPSCGISARRDVSDYEYQSVMFFEDDIAAKLKAFAKDICQTQSMTLKSRRSNRLKSRLVAHIEITKYPKLQVDGEICVGCGICARNCPEQNLKLIQKTVEIADDKGCLHCLRCMHHCPRNAISFGKLSRDLNQYTIKDRDMMYERSAGGEKNPYWQDFAQVVKKWRMNTLKYYLRHMNKPEV